MNKTIPEIAREVAAHIERVGLYQGGKFFDNSESSPAWHEVVVLPNGTTVRQFYIENAPCCFLGAVCVVVGSAQQSDSLVFRVEFQNWLDIARLAPWSDSTPQVEVVQALRRFADEYDREESRT